MRGVFRAIVVLVCAGCSYKAPETTPAPEKPAAEESIINKTTREILDLKQAKAEHPGWVVREEKLTEGNDPLTQATSARINVPSRLMAMQIEQWVRLYQAENERKPTHAELTKWMNENPDVALQARRPYHKYAYDAESGAIVILEDPELKAQIYKEKGIPLPKDE